MSINLYVDPNESLTSGTIRFRDIPVCRYSLTLDHERQIYTTREFIRIYRDMAIIREFENMLAVLKEKGSYNGIGYTLSGPVHLCIGEEAVAVGEAFCMKPMDFIFGSHRNHGFTIAKGLSAIEKLNDTALAGIMKTYLNGEVLAPVADAANEHATVKDVAIDFLLYGLLSEIFGKKTGFNRGLGGSMHAFFTPFGVYPNNAVTAGSAGIGLGAALYKKIHDASGFVTVNMGDGALGCGAAWEAMNMACMDQIREIWEKNGGLPLLFTIVNNHYAMGEQPVGETMGWKMAARVGAGITPDQMHAERVNGNDPMAVIDAVARKKERLDRGEGPAMLEFVTYRTCGHVACDFSDDRTIAEIEAWKEHDPLKCYREKLIHGGIAGEAELRNMEMDIVRRMTKICKLAADAAISPRMTSEETEAYMFAGEDAEAQTRKEKAEVLLPRSKCRRVHKIAAKARFAYDENGEPIVKNKRYNVKDAIFEPILDRFYEDPMLIAYGEAQRTTGNGVYVDMADVLPYHRFFNAPVSEAAIVSSAVGYAMCGGRAVIEIMFSDFIARAGDELINQLAKWRALSGGTLKLPILVRVPVGVGQGAQLSQDFSSLLASVPGLKVIYPVTPYDMKGMLYTALSSQDPIISFESHRIYDMGEYFFKDGVPTEAYSIPLGKADVKKEGNDITILTIGPVLYRAVEAANILQEKYGISAEVIDARSLVPFDYETVLRSVHKTGRILIVGDSTERSSIMRDIASNIAEFAFDYLDAPPIALGARNWVVPSAELAKGYFPQAETILDAIHQKIMPLRDYTPSVNMTSEEKIRRAKNGV